MIRGVYLPTRGHRFQQGLILGVVVLLLAQGCTPEASFLGTELTSNDPTPSFHLQDQFGQSVDIADLRGKVVVLTFLYTNCLDICPLITETLRRAYDSLGKDAQGTAFVAISVDPSRDTVEQIYRYSKQKGMLDKWAFLTGSYEDLEPVWLEYYVAAEMETDAEAMTTALGAEDTYVGYLVGHSAPVYLIDPTGRLRVVFTNLTLDPKPLLHDIWLLMG